MKGIDMDDEVMGRDHSDSNMFSSSFSEKTRAEINSEILNIRLNTDSVLGKIEQFISGIKFVEKTEKVGKDYVTVPKQIQTHKPLMNKEGVAMIMGILQQYLNAHMAQANTEREELFRLLREFSKQFIKFLVCNQKELGIERKNIRIIHQTIRNEVYLFLTRTVQNQERKLLGESFQSHEITRPNEKKSLLGKLFG